MGYFAWRNLMTRPLRTVLALIGLSVPVLGVMGLFSVSRGLGNMVRDTLERVEGVMVVRENVPSPVVSILPANLAEKIRAIPGVRVVAPEVWQIALNIEGSAVFSRAAKAIVKKNIGSLIDQPVIQGQDIEAHHQLKSAVYPRAIKEHGEGRFLTPDDKGKRNIVISYKIARDYPREDGKPRQLGDVLHIAGKPFTIVGLYETGSMLLDVIIIMDINTARTLFGISSDNVSSYYVETVNPGENERISEEIEKRIPNVDSRSMAEFMANFGEMLSQLDTFLMMTISLALLVGVVGIVNTMLMSTTERFIEFGVLRTNGWSKSNVLALVTIESAFLGLLAGVIGCVLVLVATGIANQMLSGGMRLDVPLKLLALGIGLSVGTGVLGGLYPAWRAARLVPMDAIRVGSH